MQSPPLAEAGAQAIGKRQGLFVSARVCATEPSLLPGIFGDLFRFDANQQGCNLRFASGSIWGFAYAKPFPLQNQLQRIKRVYLDRMASHYIMK